MGLDTVVAAVAGPVLQVVPPAVVGALAPLDKTLGLPENTALVVALLVLTLAFARIIGRLFDGSLVVWWLGYILCETAPVAHLPARRVVALQVARRSTNDAATQSCLWASVARARPPCFTRWGTTRTMPIGLHPCGNVL